MLVCIAVLVTELKRIVDHPMSRGVPGRHWLPIVCPVACQQTFGTMLSSCAVLLAEMESLVEQLDEQEAAKQQALQRAEAAEQQLAALKKKQASQPPQVSAVHLDSTWSGQ